MQALSNKLIIHKIKLIITDTLIIIQGQWCKSEPEEGEVVSEPVTNMQPHLTPKSYMPYKICFLYYISRKCKLYNRQGICSRNCCSFYFGRFTRTNWMCLSFSVHYSFSKQLTLRRACSFALLPCWLTYFFSKRYINMTNRSTIFSLFMKADIPCDYVTVIVLFRSTYWWKKGVTEAKV
jgi:hypothetical protein